MAQNFGQFLMTENGKSGALSTYTFTYVPATYGTPAYFTIVNAGSETPTAVQTVWQVYGDRVIELPAWSASYASPTSTTTH